MTTSLHQDINKEWEHFMGSHCSHLSSEDEFDEDAEDDVGWC